MSHKHTTKIELLPPAVETLLVRDVASAWPGEVLNHPSLVNQTKLRNDLLKQIGSFFSQVSNPEENIADVLKSGVVPLQEIEELYTALTQFLNSDSYNKRLVLYFPFELLPSKPELRAGELPQSLQQFVSVYMRCWRELLAITDVRANFLDGNILEPELAPQGQRLVRKAAHLIPVLFRKGLLTNTDITEIRSQADELLDICITDALPALLTQQVAPAESFTVKEPTSEVDGWPLKIADEIEAELQKIDMRFALDQSRGLPPARVVWERRNRREILTEKYARRMAGQLFTHPDEIIEVTKLLSSHPSIFTRLSMVRALGLLGEGFNTSNPEKATQVWQSLRLAYPQGLAIPELQDELIGLMSRWQTLGIVRPEDIKNLGIVLPKLDATFELEGLLADDVRAYAPVVASLAQDPNLSKLLYPAAIFFGSRFKGYAKNDADLDAAVFVRPGVAEKDRLKVRAAVSKAFKQGSVDGKVVEFWLEEHEGKFRVKDLANPDAFVADSTWVHLLFAGAWLGQRSAVEELHKQLLASFFSSDGKFRTTCLSEMEREVLQYRLMHKGYRRFHPFIGGLKFSGTELLDAQSTFWDSGYRRLATRLFIARVFLPEIQYKNLI